MIDPVRWVFAVVEVLLVVPLFVGSERLTATMLPGRDRRLLMGAAVVAVVFGVLWILFSPV